MNYIFRCGIIPYKIIQMGLSRVSVNQEYAVSVYTGSSFIKFFKIILPQIKLYIVTSLVICWIFSFGELGSIIMIYPPGGETLPTSIYSIMANSPEGYVSVLGCISLSINVVMLLVFFLLMKLFGRRDVNNKV